MDKHIYIYRYICTHTYDRTNLVVFFLICLPKKFKFFKIVRTLISITITNINIVAAIREIKKNENII